MARAGFTRSEGVLVAGAAAVVFTRVFAFSLVLPGFRPFGDSLAGATDLLVGTALGAYGLTMALSQLGLGILSDHWGRRPVLLLGTAFFVAGSAWAALAGSIWALLAARLLQGLGAVSSVAMAAVGETVPEERRTTAMALIGIPAGLGFFVGFAAGPWAEGLVGFRGLFWATAVLGILAILPLAAQPLAPPRPMPPVLPGHGKTRPVLALAVAGFTINFAMTQTAFFLPSLPLGRGGLTLALLAAFVAMALVSRNVDRHGLAKPAILACLAIVTAGVAVFLPAATTWVALVGATLFFAGHAILSAVLPSQVSRIAGRSGGRGHGIQLVVAYLGSAAGGVAAGGLANHVTWAVGAVAAVALAATLLVASALPSGRTPVPS